MKGNYRIKRMTEIIVAIAIMITRPTTAFPRLLRIGTPPFNRAGKKRIRPKTRISDAGNLISNSVDDTGKNDK